MMYKTKSWQNQNNREKSDGDREPNEGAKQREREIAIERQRESESDREPNEGA